jgi:thymidylate synthase (FAD)
MEQSTVRILDYLNNEKNCARAASISTTKGSAIKLYTRPKSQEDDRNLIKKVLASGHKSFVEHAVFTIAFNNVSALVEQFFIEFRLISFTIKSRRYVDFGDMGYYIPNFFDEQHNELYKKHMDFLFDEYNYFVSNGIPKEDARFVLPYSFFSNFYCTVNARELVHILNEIRSGRGSNIAELQDIANQLTEQLSVIMPSIAPEIKSNETTQSNDNKKVAHNTCIDNCMEDLPSVKLISSSSEQVKSLVLANMIYNSMSITDETFSSGIDYTEIINSIAKKGRARELEQLNYTYVISNITLAGITHIVRHRMQSIVIPPVHDVNINRFIVPKTISCDKDLHDRYLHLYSKNLEVYNAMAKFYTPAQLSYMALSGNTFDIVTTMNAREMRLFFSIRTCQRAQWEIRSIAIDMLKHAQNIFPQLFCLFGPSCFLKGSCPEGKLSCGNPDNIKILFSQLNNVIKDSR